MTGLAVASLRARGTSLATCFASILLGTVIVAGFASLLDTAARAGVRPADHDLLITMASVIGGWGLLIVLFAVASTLGIAVRQRGSELALLRAIGSTNRQIRSLVRRETAVVAVVAAVVALPPGWLLGRWIISLIASADMVETTVQHRLTVPTMIAVVAAMVVVSLVAATLAARSATTGRATAALGGVASGGSTMSRLRVAAGLACLLVGASLSTLTLVLPNGDDTFGAMAVAGPASIAWSLGLALWSPWLLRLVIALVGRPVARMGAPAQLAVANAAQRAVQLSSTLMPIIVLTGIGTGTMYLVAIQNSVTTAGMPDADVKSVVALNYIVIGMITVFAAIMVVNTLVAAIHGRRREFAGLRLIGSTTGDITGSIATEGVIMAGTGIVFGAAASLGTIIPFAVARTDGWLPDSGPWMFLGIAAVALGITVVTSVVAGRRAAWTAPPAGA